LTKQRKKLVKELRALFAQYAEAKLRNARELFAAANN
jgi:ATP-dependent Lon protease